MLGVEDPHLGSANGLKNHLRNINRSSAVPLCLCEPRGSCVRSHDMDAMPELKEGQFLPERSQIAAYLGQHTVRPVTRNEYMKSDAAMDAYWKEWANLEGKSVYRKETLIEWHTVRKEALAN